jgi:outer membrane protein
MNSNPRRVACGAAPCAAWPEAERESGAAHGAAPLRLVIALLLAVHSCLAASLPFVDSLYQHLYPPPAEVRVHMVEGLNERIQDGKLHLRLKDFIELVLRNSTDIQLTRLDVLTAANAITAAKSPFDPQLSLGFVVNRTDSPQYTQIGGAPTLDNLTDTAQIGYQQVLPTGQTVSTSFDANRYSSNSQYDYINPSIASGLNFNITQPLLQNRTGLQNRGPLMIARTRLLIATEQDEGVIANSLSSAAIQYWSAIQARDSIRVAERSLDLAQKSYERDKQALDLGALPKLDIYQSESEVAQRKLDVLQAQYAYRAQLDTLRRLIGADLQPATRSLEMVLEDDPSTLPLRSIDSLDVALDRAMRTRPELSALRASLSVDDLNTRVARDSLRPQLNLNLQGGSNGLGGDQIPVTGPLGGPTAFIPGGLGDALSQLFRFNAPWYQFGLQLNLPFRNSSAQANLSNSLVNKVRDRYQERQEQQQIILDVKQSLDSLDLAKAAIAAATSARDLSAKNVDAEQQKYELGGTTVFELLQAQNQLATVENSLLNAYVGYQTAFINYARATWILFDELSVQCCR